MTDSAQQTLESLLELLDLESPTAPVEGAASSGPEVYRGLSASHVIKRVFGGQVLGQSVIAAGRSVPDGRPIHSLHGYFLRPGDPAHPIDFEVERLRDGRSFSARRVQAVQHGKPILSMIASFQVAQDGIEHSDVMPSAPDPESLPTTADLIGHLDHPSARYWAFERPIDIRYVDPPLFLEPDPVPRPDQMVWMRTVAPIPDAGAACVTTPDSTPPSPDPADASSVSSTSVATDHVGASPVGTSSAAPDRAGANPSPSSTTAADPAGASPAGTSSPAPDPVSVTARNALLHSAILAFASDYSLFEPTMRQHGLAWTRPGLKMASLDHAMWWHRPARADEWLLYVSHSVSASGGRALAQGRIFSREVELVATVAQEGMVHP